MPNNAFARDTVAKKDPLLHKLWKGAEVRDEYQGMRDSLQHPGTDCSKDPGLTDQSQAAETDVNFIIKRATQSGILPGQDIERIFADVSESMDYQQARNLVINAENQFNALNAEVRKKFDNDPGQFLAFVEDPQNASELVKMGLAIARPATPSPAAPDLSGGQPDPNKDVEAKAKQPEQ